MKGVAALLDGLDANAARRALGRCCASTAWVEDMLARRPFGDDGALEQAAAAVESSLGRGDWLEAFAAHPRIGDRNGSRWSRAEQAGTAAAAEATLSSLRTANAAYEERFGHVFLICATGLDADTMLAALERRMANDPAAELDTAAAEQAKITRLRLAKLVADSETNDDLRGAPV